MNVKEFFLNQPVQREVTFCGRTEQFYFRRITGAERLQINRGQKLTVGDSKKAHFETDMADVENRKYQMVLFSMCNADGTKYFRNLDQVRELPEVAIGTLFKVAEEVNAEQEEVGKV